MKSENGKYNTFSTNKPVKLINNELYMPFEMLRDVYNVSVDTNEQNRPTIEFTDDSKAISDNGIETKENNKIEDEKDDEINSEDMAEKLAKIDPEVSTRIAESYVDYNRESMLEKKDPYKSNNKQSFKQSIKFDVKVVDFSVNSDILVMHYIVNDEARIIEIKFI